MADLALLYSLLPFLRQGAPVDPGGFAPPGTMGRPSQQDIGTALQQNPSLAGIAPDMVTGVSPAAPGRPDPFMGMALGRMGRQLGEGGGGGGADAAARPERFVHGAPQGMPPKIGNPQTDFQMAQMQNPVQSVGQFLLSPAGQQVIQALQRMGGG